ncbi:MAG: zinc-ribbon domain-containing protein [Pseudomonadales bacterium]|nr:zinc-ribbon domain-containing protein [Pseudomonadales bacterium]
MAAQYKTRCPHCAAQFKITDEHLKQARGAVRCGSCLQIFQASDYLVEPARPQPSEDRWAGALDNDAPPKKDTQTYGDEEDNGGDGLSLEGMELSDSFINLDEGSEDSGLGEDFSDMHGAGRSSHNEGADEAWAEALLKELEDDDEPDAPAEDKPAPASFAPRDEQPATSAPAAKAKPKASQPKPPEPEAGGDDDLLFGGMDLFGDELNDEPVAISRPVRERDRPFHQPRDWAGLIKWSALSVVALVILVGQYAWFNFDHLARSPQWRPLYLQACNLLGCQLPSRTDISKLRGANLVVRSHPDYANALIVDAILFNEARYPQPFPDLALSFSAMNGKPVAHRRFQPSEYLHGDLHNMDVMPTNTPLHISLEIVDPGEQAVNYNLRLLPSQEANPQVSQR